MQAVVGSLNAELQELRLKMEESMSWCSRDLLRLQENCSEQQTRADTAFREVTHSHCILYIFFILYNLHLCFKALSLNKAERTVRVRSCDPALHHLPLFFVSFFVTFLAGRVSDFAGCL